MNITGGANLSYKEVQVSGRHCSLKLDPEVIHSGSAINEGIKR